MDEPTTLTETRIVEARPGTAEETSHESKSSVGASPLGELWWRKRFRLAEFLVEKLVTAIAFLSFAFIVLIFAFVFREAAPLFFSSGEVTSVASKPAEQETYGEEQLGDAQGGALAREKEKTPIEQTGEGSATVRNLVDKTWQPVSSKPKYGLLPLVTGSFKVTIVAVLIAAPIAIFSALFTSAFAPKWSKEVLKPTIEILAGFPSVVIGFFALIAMATVLQNVFGFQYRLNAFVGGLALSLAVIPIIYTITEDSLTRVPRVMTEASLALGATKWQTALFVVLPAATPGILAAILLGIGRAFGETMIVLMATGNAAIFSAGFFEPVRTMSASIGAEMAEVVFGDTHYSVLFFIGSILFLFTFTLNAIVEIVVRQRLMKRFQGL